MTKKHLLLFAVVLGLVGCSDFLSHTPDNRTDINTTTAIEGMLVSVYPDWSYVWMTDLMTDNITDVGTVLTSTVAIQQLYNWEECDSESQDSPTGYWNRAYNAIAHANTVLEAIDNLIAEGTYTESELSHYRGEALMARAYAHFMLVNLFAEHYDPATAETTLAIPFVTEVEKVPNVTYTRQTVKEVYDLIERDIQEAFPCDGSEVLISDADMTNTSWHMNTKAAATFASRFYLWRGLDDDWEKVIYYADIALGTDPASALRDWSIADEISWEDFASRYTRSTVAANLQLKECVSLGSSLRAALYRYTISLALMREIIGTTGDIFPIKTLTGVYSHYFATMGLGYTTYGCYFVYKLEEQFQRSSINANYGTPYVMYPLFVAEEALFNKAEALVMQGDYSGARDLLDAYFSKRLKMNTGYTYSTDSYGVTEDRILSLYTSTTNHGDITPHYTLSDVQKAYVKCILRLRRLEFVHEGLRWFDIKRMHIEVTHTNVNGSTNVLTSNDSRRVISLPEAALASGLLVDPTGSNSSNNSGVSEVELVTSINVTEEPTMAFSPKDNISENQDLNQTPVLAR